MKESDRPVVKPKKIETPSLTCNLFTIILLLLLNICHIVTIVLCYQFFRKDIGYIWLISSIILLILCITLGCYVGMTLIPPNKRGKSFIPASSGKKLVTEVYGPSYTEKRIIPLENGQFAIKDVLIVQERQVLKDIRMESVWVWEEDFDVEAYHCQWKWMYTSSAFLCLGILQSYVGINVSIYYLTSMGWGIAFSIISPIILCCITAVCISM